MENKIQLFDSQQVRPVAQRRHFINRRLQSTEIREGIYTVLTPKINTL